MSVEFALRRPAIRRTLSRLAANFVAVAAIAAIFGLKAYIAGGAHALEPSAPEPMATSGPAAIGL